MYMRLLPSKTATKSVKLYQGLQETTSLSSKALKMLTNISANHSLIQLPSYQLAFLEL